MINKQIGILLDAIVEIVNDDTMPWKQKQTTIRKAVEDDESYEVNFEEFMSWFEPDDRS